MILLKSTVYFQDWDNYLLQNVGKFQSPYTASYATFIVKQKWSNETIIILRSFSQMLNAFWRKNFSGIWWMSGSQMKDIFTQIFKGSHPMKKSQWLPLKMNTQQSFETSGTACAEAHCHTALRTSSLPKLFTYH